MNPNAPTSKVNRPTVQSLSSNWVFNFAYLASFLIAASTILRSKGTVSSNMKSVLVAKEKMTRSGRERVSTLVWPGIVGLPEKSKLICQSEALLALRIELVLLGRLGLGSPFLTNLIEGGRGVLQLALRRLIDLTSPIKSLCMAMSTLSCLHVYLSWVRAT